MVNKVNLDSQKLYLNPTQSRETKAESDNISIKDEVVQVPEENQHKKWLVILYSAGDNNLYSSLFDDLNELEKVGSDQNTHMVSISDQGNYGKQWKNAKTFYLYPDADLSKVNSPVIENLGKINTADPNFMGTKIGELMKKFPADHVIVILSDHGAGWEGAIEDDTHNKFMSLSEIKQALAKAVEIGGKKIDILGWDACLMAMAEVGYELRDFAKYMVASEQTEGADGWPYGSIFGKTLADVLKVAQQMMLINVDVEPKDLASMIVKATTNFTHSIKTLSAVDLEKANLVAEKTNALAQAIMNNPQDFKTIKSIISSTEKFYGTFRDLGHFAQQLANAQVSDDVKKAANELVVALNEYVVKEFHTNQHPNATGVSVEMPTWGGPSSSYQGTSFAKDTLWDEMLKKVNS
ncbi:MAG: clostripain-related cysteine peptidase [bacterium]